MCKLKHMLGITNIKEVLRYNCLRWFDHLEHMADDTWPKRILKMNYEITVTKSREVRKEMEQ